MNSSRSIDQSYDLLPVMIYAIYDAITCSCQEPWSHQGYLGTPCQWLRRGASSPIPSRNRGLLCCHSESCPSHSCNCCPLAPHGPRLPLENYFLSRRHAQDMLRPLCSSGEGGKCPNSWVGVGGWGWELSGLHWRLTPG